MSNARPDIQDIFCEALEKTSPEERHEFLDDACGNDGELRDQVEGLLDSHDAGGRFLGGVAPLDPTCNMPPIAEKPGIVIDRYKLLEQIGEGGFGVVFMAEQEKPVRRKVALKIIKPGMDTKEVIARFEVERQALAIMDHPNIATVLDVGATESGRPYFVMELVRGILITEFCDQNNLSTRERMELFGQVCQAVQHAHQKGIIHRDIKPSNVLVTMHDDKPVPKVIDFGVAKATNTRLTERSLFTRFAQMVGTPLYMSPEQAQMSGLDIDTRSDIYSLGVLLYELLTGATPFDQERIREAAHDEFLRIIREEEPPKPSTRVSTLGEAVTTSCDRRNTDARHLSRLLRGELDWIVMKALEKDRTRRYETANGFAADIQRYLNDEPVLACPPSAAYRLKKFTRRNKAALITTAIVVCALVVGTGVSIWQAVEAEDARKLADQRFTEADNARKLASNHLKRESEARREAEEQRKLADDNFQEARRAVDTMYTEVAARWLSAQGELTDVQKSFLVKALVFYRKLTIDGPATPALRFETAMAYQRVAMIEDELGNIDQSLEAFREAIHILEELLSHDPPNALFRNQLASWYTQFSVKLSTTLKDREAEPLLHKATQLRKSLVAEHPARLNYQHGLAFTHRILGEYFRRRGQEERATEFFEEAESLARSIVMSQPGNPLYTRELTWIYFSLGDGARISSHFKEAEQTYRKALSLIESRLTRSPHSRYTRKDFGLCLASLGVTLNELQRFKEAESFFEKSKNVRKQLVEEFPSLVRFQDDLDGAFIDLLRLAKRNNDVERIERLYLEKLQCLMRTAEIAVKQRVVPATNRLMSSHIEIAHFYMQSGDKAAAEQHYTDAVTAARKCVESATLEQRKEVLLQLVNASYQLANMFEGLNRYEDALDHYMQQWESARQYAELEDYVTGYYGPAMEILALENLMRIRREQARWAEGLKYWKTVREIVESLTPNAFQRTGDDNLAVALGRSLSELGRIDLGMGDSPETANLPAEVKQLVEQLRLVEMKDGRSLNILAWHLTINPSPRLRYPGLACRLAQRAVESGPEATNYANTHGVARYGNGEFELAIAELKRTLSLPNGKDSFSWFFLAMAHQKLGNEEQALENYELAIAWMDEHRPDNEELLQIRAETEELLGVLGTRRPAEDASDK